MIEVGQLKKRIILIAIFILLTINYRFIISLKFGYLGFSFEYFTLGKLIFVFLFCIILIFIGLFIKNQFYRLIYDILLVLILFGQSIFYIYNDSEFILVVFVSIPILLIYILDKLDGDKLALKMVKYELNDTYSYIFLILVTIFLIAPYFVNISNINWSNLLFIDVYESRGENSSNTVMGYLFSPISRVLLPFLLIYSITQKKKILTFFSGACIILMFLLNGALKSILVGLVVAIFFIKGSYKQKASRFLYAILITFGISIFHHLITGSSLIADYIRRLFFTPARLFQVYYDYFNENHTYFLHSRLSKILNINQYEGSLPLYVGENVIGIPGHIANVGIFAEGFISFGTAGVILFSIIFMFLIYILKLLNFQPFYFGIVFSYIYVINTSFIETLLITHGFLFLIIFGYFIIPRRGRDYEEIYRRGAF